MRTRRLDALLTPSRLTAYPLILGVGGLLALVITSVLSPLPFPDFVARWTAGVLVRSGEASNLYDPVNLESLHILNQCLKAHTLFKRGF